MSTLDRIRAYQQSRQQVVRVGDVEVALTPISAKHGLKLQGSHASAEGRLGDDETLLEFWVDCIAYSARDGSELVFDSEEGREVLRNLPLHELQDLGAAAGELSGILRERGDAKKKD